MNTLSFLSNLALADNAVAKPATVKTRTNASKNPTGSDLRVYRSGAVFPSAALTATDNLDYLAKDAEGTAFGYDVFSSLEFANSRHWTSIDPKMKFLFIAKVAKSEPKVDLFGRTTYAEDGTPGEVMSQGAATFGKALLEDLQTIYGFEIPEGEQFVDLTIVDPATIGANLVNPDGIYYVPKVISRGEKKGQRDIVRREDIYINVLIPTVMIVVSNTEGIDHSEVSSEEILSAEEIAVEVVQEVKFKEEEKEIEEIASTITLITVVDGEEDEFDLANDPAFTGEAA